MWKILTNPLAGPLASGLALLAVVGLGAPLLMAKMEIRSLHREAEQTQKRIDGLIYDKVVLQANQTTLQDGINKCNAGVLAVQAKTNEVTQAGLSALQQVQQAGKSVDRKVAAIDSMPKETCEDAVKILKAH